MRAALKPSGVFVQVNLLGKKACYPEVRGGR